MALTFPSSPSNGQTYSYNGDTYIFDGKRWTKQAQTLDLDSVYATDAELASATSGLASTSYVDTQLANAGGSSVTHSATAPSSPVDGDMWFDSANKKLYIYDSGWQKIQALFSASGGTTWDSGGYRYHKFTTSSTFQVQTGDKEIEYVLVAGGGAGGGSDPGLGGGGGGGAGGMITGTFNVSAGNYSLIVGAGGAGNYRTRGSSGGNTTGFGVTAIGGGGGGDGDAGGASSGLSGGSGGGGGYRTYTTQANGGAGTSGQGYAGSGVWGGSASGGGGGGKAGPGSQNTGSGGGSGGIGGPGLAWFDGVTYAKGGQGGASSGITGASNTGNGGDGMYADSTGKNGGSGVVVLRYLI